MKTASGKSSGSLSGRGQLFEMGDGLIAEIADRAAVESGQAVNRHQLELIQFLRQSAAGGRYCPLVFEPSAPDKARCR